MLPSQGSWRLEVQYDEILSNIKPSEVIGNDMKTICIDLPESARSDHVPYHGFEDCVTANVKVDGEVSCVRNTETYGKPAHRLPATKAHNGMTYSLEPKNDQSLLSCLVAQPSTSRSMVEDFSRISTRPTKQVENRFPSCATATEGAIDSDVLLGLSLGLPTANAQAKSCDSLETGSALSNGFIPHSCESEIDDVEHSINGGGSSASSIALSTNDWCYNVTESIVPSERYWRSNELRKPLAKLENCGIVQGPVSERVFSCQFCTRSFYSSQALGGHQNGHKNERSELKSKQEYSSALARQGFSSMVAVSPYCVSESRKPVTGPLGIKARSLIHTHKNSVQRSSRGTDLRQAHHRSTRARPLTIGEHSTAGGKFVSGEPAAKFMRIGRVAKLDNQFLHADRPSDSSLMTNGGMLQVSGGMHSWKQVRSGSVDAHQMSNQSGQLGAVFESPPPVRDGVPTLDLSLRL